MSNDDARNIPRRATQTSCETAASNYRGVLEASHGDKQPKDPDPSVFLRRDFWAWAEREGYILEALPADFSSIGHEHAIAFGGDNRVLKATIDGFFGYCVEIDEDGPALYPNTSPLVYLDRLTLHQQMFHVEQAVFLGLYGDRGNYTIVTQHPFVEGTRGSFEGITATMLAHGFQPYPKAFGHETSLTFFNEIAFVSDLRPVNVVHVAGLDIPVDALVTPIDAVQYERLQRLAKNS